MAARTARKTTATKAKPAPAPEVEEDFEEELETEDTDAEVEVEDDDLEDLEEDEVAETKPVSKKSKATDTVTFGIRDLVALIKKETGEDTDPRALRTLIRKMARDKSGRVDREITAGNRTRYDWSGPNDPEVRNILKAFQAGELEADKQEKLKALKERKAALTAKKKAAAAAEVEEADEDDEDEEPTPTPRRRKKAAPAPAKPARRRAKPAPVEDVEDDEELDLDED